MTALAGARDRRELLDRAILQNNRTSKEGVSERLFALAFRGLVYPQIWEDPVIDMEALDVQPNHHMLTIASGGCNVFSYLTAGPAKVTAVDLNAGHVALNNLKRAALQYLPNHAALSDFFKASDHKSNIKLYEKYLRPNLDPTTRNYWDKRQLNGRARIHQFTTGFYHQGLLGRFIGASHFLARRFGVDLSVMLKAETMEEQRALFDTELAPLFDRKLMRWLTKHKSSLFGLGIPPAQYEALAGNRDMRDVLRERLEKLACNFPIRDNYFAHQAFGRCYANGQNASVPPYLEVRHFDQLKKDAGKVEIRNQNFIDYLQQSPAQSLDRFVLLDAQDWMTDDLLNLLWTEISRTARPDARVLFRTAAEPDLLPGRVSKIILQQWEYQNEASLDYTRRDRSAIYGGVHLYIRRHWSR